MNHGLPCQIHVLVSAYACEPGKGSEPGLAWGWVWGLAQAGLQVTVLTRPDGQTAIERFLETHRPPGNLRFEYVTVPLNALRTRGAWRVYEHYRLWQHAAYECAKLLSETVDVVHHVSWGALLGGSELWRLGKPFIFGPVGGGQKVPSLLFGLLRGDLLRTLVRQLNILVAWTGLGGQHIAATSWLLSTNLETAALATRLGAQRVIQFVDSGVDSRFILEEQPTNKERKPPLRVLWVGRLLPRKAALLAVAAISLTKCSMELTIVGDGPERARIQRAIDQLGVGPKVNITSWVPWYEMPAQYQNHDVFLFTSILDSFGSQLLEAMASGLPVVALKHQGAGSFVSQEEGILVTPTTPRRTALALADALDRLAEDAVLRSGMGKAAWRHASTETWDRRVQRILPIYRRALADDA